MRNSRGFTLVELLIVTAIVGVLLAVSALSYRYARVTAGESSAVAALSAINQAQFAFMQTCGYQNYAPTLMSLGVKPPGAQAAFLSPDLARAEQVVKSGYRIAMTGTPALDVRPTCTAEDPVSGYVATADPVIPGGQGYRYFATNTDRVIYRDIATYVGNMPETGAPGHGTEITGR